MSRFFFALLFFTAHTLGSDETPSSFIPDPSRHDDDDDEEDEEELEIATRSLIFWQDGFSVEDSDLLKYEENQELLQAIQSGYVVLQSSPHTNKLYLSLYCYFLWTDLRFWGGAKRKKREERKNFPIAERFYLLLVEYRE